MANPKPVDRRENLTKAGANFGNKGGLGAVPSVVRQACREAFADRIGVLADIADDKVDGATPNERINAVKTLGSFGLGQRTELVIDNTTMFSALGDILPNYLDQEQCAAFLRDLHETLSSNAG